MHIIKGYSSLLFIVSFIRSLYGDLFLYKISHVLLIIASFLCNASEFDSWYVQMDYASIFLISTSYLNNAAINGGFAIYIIYEYSNYRSIENAKNMAFGTSVATSIYKGYYYLDNAHFYTLVISSVAGVIIYKIRYDTLTRPEITGNTNTPQFPIISNNTYILLLTSVFHVCVMNILYISCLTAGK
jgi:hypothetical protein